MFSLETFLIVTAIVLGLLALAFWIAMAVHCWKNPALGREERLLWLLLMVVGKLLGTAIYYFFHYRRPGTSVAENGPGASAVSLAA